MEKRNNGLSSIDEYIASFPDEVQVKLRELRAVIKSAAPEAVEKMSYQMPTFALYGNLVHFAAYNNHIGFYPAPRAIEIFQSELAQYEGGKGTVRFPLDKPIPYDLIKRIVEFRVKENLEKQALRLKKKPLKTK